MRATFGDAAFAGELRLLAHVQSLAVYGHQEVRIHPIVHAAQLAPARMAGHVDEVGAVGDDLDALLDQRVDDRADAALVARDGARREDDAIAGTERDLRMVVARDARQGSPLFSLTAGAEQHDLVARKMAEGVLVLERRQPVEISAVCRHLDHAPHRATGRDDLAVARPCGLGDGADAGDVGGKDRDRHAVGRASDEFGEVSADLAFRRTFALAQRIGGIADHGVDAGRADLAQRRLVRRRADDGFGIEPPVSGMEHAAQRGRDRERVRFGDRMGNPDEADVERTDVDRTSERHDLDIELRGRIASLARFGRQKRGGEGRRVDGGPHARIEVEHRADMIFVAMGQHDAHQVLALDEARVGHENVDAGQAAAGEADAEIDHDPLARALVAEAVESQVHADFTRPSEGQEYQ